MEKFFSEVVTAYWWASVVIVGVILNWAGSYVKGPLDLLLSSSSAKWKARTERDRKLRAKRVQELATDSEVRVSAEIRSSTMVSISLFFGLNGMLMLIVGALLHQSRSGAGLIVLALYFIGELVFFVVGFAALKIALRIRSEVGEARGMLKSKIAPTENLEDHGLMVNA